MRVHLQIATQNEIIPFEHQHLLVGCIHKWLGHNEQHGRLSFFSFSRLEGKKASVKTGLHFNETVSFFVSAFDTNLIKTLISGIRKDPSMFFRLEVREVMIEEEPDLTNKERFYLGSPILIKRDNNDKAEHILYNDPCAPQYLKETLLTKMEKVGLDDDSLEVFFDQQYSGAKTALINYKGIQNKTSWCPVIIRGRLETKLFAWNVGLGNSTGIGFGSIK